MFPFTLEEFFDMMASYNTALWPAQLFAYALGIAAVILAIRGPGYSNRLISGILAVFWLWVGVIFNGLFLSRLSSRANIFAVLFILQGIILAVEGVIRRRLAFGVKADAYGVGGALVILYAMAGYPLIEYLLGRGYPQLLSFGLVPCPTTVFTLGMLLWTKKKLPKHVLALPFLYSLGGVMVALVGVVEDIGMTAAGLVTAVMILYRDRANEGA